LMLFFVVWEDNKSGRGGVIGIAMGQEVAGSVTGDRVVRT
jgi:hypothetical protein